RAPCAPMPRMPSQRSQRVRAPGGAAGKWDRARPTVFAMPGIFGAVGTAPRQAAALPLEELGERLRVQPAPRVPPARSEDGRAALGGVDLGVLAGSGTPHRAGDGS